MGKGNQSEGFRCTVCGAEIKSNISTIPKKEIKYNFKIFLEIKNLFVPLCYAKVRNIALCCNGLANRPLTARVTVRISAEQLNL